MQAWLKIESNRLLVLRVLIAASVVSTALHFAHNYVEVHHYPESDLATYATTRRLILIVWPTLMTIGLLGYWLYAGRVYGLAYLCLAAYSLTGIITVAHFVDGSPDIPPFWYVTIFTDAIAGAAILTFVIWSALTVHVARAPVQT